MVTTTTPKGSPVFPPSVPVTLRNPRSEEVREYIQTELTIEGEARLLGLVHETAAKLNDAGFPWDQLGPLFDEREPMDWVMATDLLARVATVAPDAITDAVTIFLGIYPTNEDGSRNADYEDERRFIRSAVKFATFVDMVKTFAEQNDYQRLADPIGAILGQAARTGMASAMSTSGISTNDETSDGSSKP